MGLDSYMYKIRKQILKNNEDLKNFLDIHGYNKAEEIGYWRRNYILEEWFRKHSINSDHYDEFILKKNDINRFKDYCIQDGIWDKDENVRYVIQRILDDYRSDETMFYDSCS